VYPSINRGPSVCKRCACKVSHALPANLTFSARQGTDIHIPIRRSPPRICSRLRHRLLALGSFIVWKARYLRAKDAAAGSTPPSATLDQSQPSPSRRPPHFSVLHFHDSDVLVVWTKVSIQPRVPRAARRYHSRFRLRLLFSSSELRITSELFSWVFLLRTCSVSRTHLFRQFIFCAYHPGPKVPFTSQPHRDVRTREPRLPVPISVTCSQPAVLFGQAHHWRFDCLACFGGTSFASSVVRHDRQSSGTSHSTSTL